MVHPTSVDAGTPLKARLASITRLGARIRNLLPAGDEVIGILGLVVFAVHSWSVRGFLYNLPSFVLRYSAGEILVIFCYHMALAFLESLWALLILLMLGALLPSSLLRQGFVYKGSVIVAAATVAAIFLQYSYVSEAFAFEGAGRDAFLAKAVAGLAAFLIAYVFVVRSPRLQRVLEFLVDQVSVMLFIYAPLGLIGLAVVFLRLIG